MEDTPQKKYTKTKKGKNAALRAQQKYDKKNPEKRRTQKKEYMRKKRNQDPSYCKWK